MSEGKPMINVGTIGHVDHGRTTVRLAKALVMTVLPLTHMNPRDEEKERGITVSSEGSSSTVVVTDAGRDLIVKKLESEGYVCSVQGDAILITNNRLEEALEKAIEELREEETRRSRNVAICSLGIPVGECFSDLLALEIPEFKWEPEPPTVSTELNPFDNKHSMRQMNKRVESKFRGIKRAQKYKAQAAKRRGKK
ncbi:elongation factor Tu [Vibrio phage Va2]|nr:elongation factor Tu [Vibrio phage Va2]